MKAKVPAELAMAAEVGLAPGRAGGTRDPELCVGQMGREGRMRVAGVASYFAGLLPSGLERPPPARSAAALHRVEGRELALLWCRPGFAAQPRAEEFSSGSTVS